MKPRERAGQDSMARAAPAGHSAPIPMPSRARKKNKNAKLGENPAMKLQSEYQRIEIISGAFRPMRSAIQPAAVAPTKRSHRVMVNTAATAVKGTPNSLEIGSIISKKTVKSKASSVQPNQAAIHAFHCSLVGSFHQGISEEMLRADMECSACCEDELSGAPKKTGISREARPADGFKCAEQGSRHIPALNKPNQPISHYPAFQE